MNKTIVTEQAINSAVEFLNKANEKEFIKIFKDFQKEQPFLSTYLFAIKEVYELEEEAFEEIYNLSLIVWKSFKNTTSFIPEISEEIIEEVDNESDELNKNLAKTLGLDLEDENADLSKLKEINKALENKIINEEAIRNLIQKNDLQGFLEQTVGAFNNSQTELMDFVSDEIEAIEEFEQTDSYLYIEILFDVIKCFDKAVNKSPLKIVK